MTTRLTSQRLQMATVTISICLVSASIRASEPVEPVEVQVKGGKHVGAGFGLLPQQECNELPLKLHAPPSQQIVFSEVIDGEGLALWDAAENEPGPTHQYTAYGVSVNHSHAVRIRGELEWTGPGGTGGGSGTNGSNGTPIFNASVAYLDMDIDSEGPFDSDLQDANEFGECGGMAMPVTLQSTFVPATLPHDTTGGFALRLRLHTKVAGEIDFSGFGPGVGIYRVAEDGEYVQVAEPFHWGAGNFPETFWIHTGEVFVAREDITATFTPEDGTGTAEDIVTVYPIDGPRVNATVDSNNDGFINALDDAIEDVPPGAIVTVGINSHGRLAVELPPGWNYGDLFGYEVQVNSCGVALETGQTDSNGEPVVDTQLTRYLYGDDPASDLPDPLQIRELLDQAGEPVTGEGELEAILRDPLGEVVSFNSPIKVKVEQQVPCECTEEQARFSLMSKARWYHPFHETGTNPKSQKLPEPADRRPFDWKEREDGVIIWQVKTTAEETGIMDPLDNPPPSGKRNLMDLATRCYYGDYHLTLKFRVPNRRSHFTVQDGDAHYATKGVRNWGNSGVIPMMLYEMQIHDSYKSPNTVTGETTSYGLKLVMPNKQLCGAMYDAHAPTVLPMHEAAGDHEPSGDWNDLDIYFMSARFNRQGDKQKNATIRVKINGTDVYTIVEDGKTIHQVAVTRGTGNSRRDWSERFPCQQDDDLYPPGPNGARYLQSFGPLLLQEHDNAVEFREIEIDTAWIPKNDQGQFDADWQK